MPFNSSGYRNEKPGLQRNAHCIQGDSAAPANREKLIDAKRFLTTDRHFPSAIDLLYDASLLRLREQCR